LAPGNFGYLSLNNSAVDANSLQNWIGNGLSVTDINSLTAPQTYTGANGGTYSDNLFPIKSSDVSKLYPNQHDNVQFDWQGITGIKDSVLQELTPFVGKVAFLPLFRPGALPGNNRNDYVSSTKGQGPYDPLLNGGSGAGTNSYYNIVDYIGITITTVDMQGSKNISIQPGAVMPKGATFINPAGDPAGSTTFSYSFLPPKLIAIP